LRVYIQGIVEDLSNWRHYIFIAQDTPDIHYLDASLLDNCAEIENFVLGGSVSSEENDDLEFF